MNLRMNTHRLDEIENERTFKRIIAWGVVSIIYELALCIPFFREAMHLINAILAETNNN